MPTTVEEIQAILASRTSAGSRCGRTGRAATTATAARPRASSGCVIVSLRNMNQVLEINEELGYAVVEPGVRWFDLYEAIEAQGASYMLSIADLGWGSVVGNTLEHGGTYLPYGLDFQMQCGMEVVLADGTLMRTGMGAMEGNKAWHCYKRGLGPTPDQMFMQSNFGIVTKMGVLAHAQARGVHAALAAVPRDDDIAPLDRHAAHAHARRDDPDGPADHELAAARRGALEPAASGTTGRRRRCPTRRSRP